MKLSPRSSEGTPSILISPRRSENELGPSEGGHIDEGLSNGAIVMLLKVCPEDRGGQNLISVMFFFTLHLLT